MGNLRGGNHGQASGRLGGYDRRNAGVGAAAVPAIQAKPIVDLAVAVRRLSDVETLFPALKAQGFYHAAHCDDEGQILLVCGDSEADTRTCRIHVVRADSMEWRNYINFRDYLNFYPKKAAEYESLKQELQQRFPNDRNAYTEGKAEWIAYALRKALVWAFLGERVHVEMDRHIGTEHPKHPGLYCPINYGYLPGVVGGFREEITYAMKDRKGQKRVTLFLGRLEGGLSLRREEIAAARWMSAEQALVFLHKGYRPILEKAEDFLSKQG